MPKVKVPDYMKQSKEVQQAAETVILRVTALVEQHEGRTPDRSEADALATEMIKAHTKDTYVD